SQLSTLVAQKRLPNPATRSSWTPDQHLSWKLASTTVLTELIFKDHLAGLPPSTFTTLPNGCTVPSNPSDINASNILRGMATAWTSDIRNIISRHHGSLSTPIPTDPLYYKQTIDSLVAATGGEQFAPNPNSNVARSPNNLVLKNILGCDLDS